VRCFFFDGDGIEVTFIGLTITNGYASSSSPDGAYGGAVHTTSTSVSLTFTSCTISSSSATYGSGVYVGSSAMLVMDFCTFYYNRGASAGGGLYFSGSSATLSHLTFSTNYAAAGGGAYLTTGAVLLVGYAFESNTGSVGLDLFAHSSSALTLESSCDSDTYNYGRNLLECSGCSVPFLPAQYDIQYVFPSPVPTLAPVTSSSSAPTSATNGTVPVPPLNWCAISTPGIEVDSQNSLAASIVPNRTVYLSADVYLSSTLYLLIGVNERLDGLVVDGGGQYKVDGQDSVRCLFLYGSGMQVGLKDLTVTNCSISSGSTHGNYGGAIYVGGGAVLEMDGCTVSNSKTASYGQGAGIYVDEATLILVNTVIEFNVMHYGKGAGVYLTSSSVLTMAGGSLKNNFARSAGCYTAATMEGGGLYVSNGALATITDGASIENNIAYRGGGIYVASYGELVLQNASLIGNSYTKVFSGSTYTSWYRSGCSAGYDYRSYGGGIYADSNAKVTLVGSIVKSNAAYYYGGGVYFSSGTSASIHESKFSSNYARYRGIQ